MEPIQFVMVLVLLNVQHRITKALKEEQTLQLTSQSSSWDDYKDICSSLAGKSVFCSENDTTECSPDIPNHYDVSNLPTTFTAWIDAYLKISYIVSFEGCYDIPSDKNMFYIRKNNVPSLRDCVLSCQATTIRHIGLSGTDCYCIIESLISPVSHIAKRLSKSECTDTDNSTSRIVMDVYKKEESTLTVDRCPIASNLGSGYAFTGAEDCMSNLTYFCAHLDHEYGPDTWYDADETCRNMSSRLLHKDELITRLQKQFWLSGRNIRELDFDGSTKGKTYDTRCVALKKDESAQLEFTVLDCSKKLPALCMNYFEVEQDTTVTYEPPVTTELEVTIATTDDNLTGGSGEVIISSEDYSTEIHASTLPDQTQSSADLYTKIYQKPAAKLPEDNISKIVGIVVGVAVIILAVIAFIYYKRKKKQFQERLLHQKGSTFQSFEGDPEEVQSQTMRYLPSVITYPSGYNVDDITGKHFRDINGEQIEVSATVHNETKSLTVSEENLDKKEDTELKEIFQTGSDKSHNGEKDSHYILFSAKYDQKGNVHTEKIDTEDRYVSIARPDDDTKCNVMLVESTTESGLWDRTENNLESTINHAGNNTNGDEHRIAEADDITHETQTEMKEDTSSTDWKETNQNMAYFDNDVKEVLVQMTNDIKVITDNSYCNEEVDINTLRALVGDENGELDLSPEIYENSLLMGRMDSAIFK